MGSVMTEVFHEPAQSWPSNMIDARAHQSDQQRLLDPPYRSSSSSSVSSSHQHNHTPSLPRNDSTSADASSTPSRQSSHANSSNSHNRSRSESARNPAPQRQAAPASPALPPTEPQDVTVAQEQRSSARDSAPTPSQRNPLFSASQPQNSSTSSPARINVQSLAHIQNIAGNEPGLLSPNPSEADDDTAPQYVISDMPVGDIIEMVAGLLTKITTTNDQHYEHLHRSIPPPDAAGSLSPQTSSVLAFHGKNVPSITILSYLSRIQKYCPATYEVFLSLLVYFDRMTERVNSGQMQSLRQANQESIERHQSRPERAMAESPTDAEKASADLTPPSSDTRSPRISRQRHSSALPVVQEPPSPPLSDSDPANLSHFFVVDSFNIHRLVIAGVTCAAKFFSDVFFTNSRYAKVGGLPLIELNHLELQFLLLNDFRLAITVEELDQYATMLVEFYAREVAAQRQSESTDGMEGVSMVSR